MERPFFKRFGCDERKKMSGVRQRLYAQGTVGCSVSKESSGHSGMLVGKSPEERLQAQDRKLLVA